MKEHPILFSGPMIRALLDGRKTQTRRPVTDRNSRGNLRASELLISDPRVFVDGGPSPAGNAGPYLHVPINCAAMCARHGWSEGDCDPAVRERLYPVYEVGDRLWVRETHVYLCDPFQILPQVGYRADRAQRRVENFPDGVTVFNEEKPDRWHWRPSIFMPRWASRITLEITDIRAERLQEISEEDARAEGVERGSLPEDSTESDGALNAECGYFPPRSYAGGFCQLWDSLNAKRAPWESNPWVWVLSFRRIEEARAAA